MGWSGGGGGRGHACGCSSDKQIENKALHVTHDCWCAIMWFPKAWRKPLKIQWADKQQPHSSGSCLTAAAVFAIQQCLFPGSRRTFNSGPACRKAASLDNIETSIQTHTRDPRANTLHPGPWVSRYRHGPALPSGQRPRRTEHQRLTCLFKWRIWASIIYRSEHKDLQLLQVHISVSSVWSHDILLENKGPSQGEERQMALMATWNCEKCFSQSGIFILRGQHKTLRAELLWTSPMKLTFPTRIPPQQPLLIQPGVSNNVTAFLLLPWKQNYERSGG